MPRTKTEESLAEAERVHSDDPHRADVINRARHFKASWVELGEALAEVKREQSWKRWGHASFEDYAKKELHLRQETVEKLTGSFLFLQKSAPEVLRRDGVATPIPTWQAVDFLRRAEEQEDAPRETVAELRRKVIDEGAPLPALARKFKDTLFPVDDEQRKERAAGSLLHAARRLRELLGETKAVPRRMAEDVSEALDQLIEKLGE